MFSLIVTVKRLDKTLPELKDTLAQIEDLGNQESSSGNMTESIRRIMDVIQETRNFVNRVKTSHITSPYTTDLALQLFVKIC